MMIDYLLAIATVFGVVMIESDRVAISRFCLAFFGFFSSLSLISAGAGFGGILLLFNLSIFSTILLAVFENSTGERYSSVSGPVRGSHIVHGLAYGAAFLITVAVFTDFYIPFNLAVGAFGMLRRSILKALLSVKLLESVIYTGVTVYHLVGFLETVLFNLWIAFSSILILWIALARQTK